MVNIMTPSLAQVSQAYYLLRDLGSLNLGFVVAIQPNYPSLEIDSWGSSTNADSWTTTIAVSSKVFYL